ncbi:GntR family transcriptional regulator [Paratissierella segnis]|jgi:DNA-binding transcriptional regulator YhcF (GntR family)|uniref:GntR family transcriptional regulator n=1 Tax=Paratissierella segnis TaxID=2763679 RepID=A0A926ENL4_9FIRM|nr:GntR family transcriptional regulator [Paratissierella segnis]MBC8586803.1 GntR family transcriptional regulator [Paratissierella segnis]
MNFDSNLPIYIQIMDLIKRQVITGDLKEGDKLPSVREIATQLKVNPNTIQRSYQELERENLVYTQRGMGTFVTEDKQLVKELKVNIAKNIINNFLDDMKAIGYSPHEILDLISNRVREGK